MAIDGVYAADDDDRPQFQVLPAPDDEEIVRLTASLAERIPKLLQRRGLEPDSDPEESDPLSRDQPWLAGLYTASVAGRVAFGPNAVCAGAVRFWIESSARCHSRLESHRRGAIRDLKSSVTPEVGRWSPPRLT